jgi:hypothetical protein
MYNRPGRSWIYEPNARCQMTRPYILLAFTVLGFIAAFLCWVLKIVFDKRRHAFPTELPNRLPKLSIANGPSLKTGSSRHTFWGAETVSPSSSDKQRTLPARTPSTSVTNAERTRSFQPFEAPVIRNPHDTLRVSPYTRPRPITLNIDGKYKDPLVERFERLKSHWNGKSQSQSSVSAVLQPLSPPSTILSTKPTGSRRPALLATKHIWNKMARSNKTGTKAIGNSIRASVGRRLYSSTTDNLNGWLEI